MGSDRYHGPQSQLKVEVRTALRRSLSRASKFEIELKRPSGSVPLRAASLK